MEKLTGEDSEQCPCQIKRLEDVAGVVGSLCYKLPLEFVEELKIQLYMYNACVFWLAKSLFIVGI